jgi:hypothetical protein
VPQLRREPNRRGRRLDGDLGLGTAQAQLLGEAGHPVNDPAPAAATTIRAALTSSAIRRTGVAR